MKRILFEATAKEQFDYWEKTNKKTFQKILSLLDETRKNPSKGTGKPEPLKHQFRGYWSRRIDSANRLVYKVTDDAVIVVACRFHY